MMNGGTGPYCADMDNESLKVEYHNTKCKEIKSTWMSNWFMRMMQVFCILDNLNFTKNGTSFHSNQISENIKKKVEVCFKDDQETILYIGTKYNIWGPDFFPETWGLNRKPQERILPYIKRVMRAFSLRESYCTGFEECSPEYMAKMNKILKTFDQTYYFSVATGERKKLREKQRDVFNHPQKLSDTFVGFDTKVS